jgi:hypothetical protein
VSAAVLATVCCVFSAASDLVYWRQQVSEGQDAGLETLLDVLLAVALLSSVAGALVAVVVALRGFVRRRGRDARLAVVAFVLCLAPWISFWITDLINDAGS